MHSLVVNCKIWQNLFPKKFLSKIPNALQYTYTYLWLWSNRHTSCLIFPYRAYFKTLLLPKRLVIKIRRGEISESIKIGLVKLPNFWLTIFYDFKKKIVQGNWDEIGWNKKQLIIKCQKGARKMPSYNSQVCAHQLKIHM